MTTHHPITFAAPRDMAVGARPLLLQRSDEDFIESTLDDLRTPAGRQALQALRAAAVDANGTRKLFQPIQRQFHLAVLEAWCELPGLPRIDPAQVDSAGLCLRRLGAGDAPEGWMRSKGRVRGWVPLNRVGGRDVPPAPEVRLQQGLTGVGSIDRELVAFQRQRADSLLSEHVIPLYLAPPDVCVEAGKTLFYGIVPTVSSELSEAAPTLSSPAGDDFLNPQSAVFQSHLVEALRGQAMDLPFPGEAVRAGWFDASEMPGDVAPNGVSDDQWSDLQNPASDNSRRLQRFILLLRQLGAEFNAFEGGAEVAALKTQLAQARLPLVLRDGETEDDRRFVTADVFLAQASAVLLDKQVLGFDVEMPETWPAQDGAALGAALGTAMQARFAAMKGRAGRFDEPQARYVVRAFVRLKAEGTCPSRTVWSEDSEPFVIAPWYEGAGAPPVQIRLPDPSDRAAMKALKPSVAFVVPPSLQNLLSGRVKDLMEGKGSTGGLGLTWICGFNIPLITICAFIVLNIFFSLFNLVFGWIFLLKICIPFPNIGNKLPPELPPP